MTKYIYLDNWVFSSFTQGGLGNRLAAFIRNNDYTIVVNTVAFVELFNPGWHSHVGEDRVVRVARFLCDHPCHTVFPEKVFEAEIKAYPNPLRELPVALDLSTIPSAQRLPTLIKFLRGGSVFAVLGKDLSAWASAFATLKRSWLDDVEQIIDDSVHQGVLKLDRRGRFTDLARSQERFLQSLDRRQFTMHLFQMNTPEVLRLFLEATSALPAIRTSSLCFWYAYIDQDKDFQMKRSNSDIADFYQISLLPYCSAFTTDNAMFRLCSRIKSELNLECELLSPATLRQQLEQA